VESLIEFAPGRSLVYLLGLAKRGDDVSHLRWQCN
jgi:hypothetical protein